MDFSLVGMWKSMGLPARLVVITLAIMSVYSLSVMAERRFSFSRAKDQSRKYAEKLRELLPRHQMIEDPQMATTMRYGHIRRVLGAVICDFFFFQAEDGIRDLTVTGVQTCALPI